MFDTKLIGALYPLVFFVFQGRISVTLFFAIVFFFNFNKIKNLRFSISTFVFHLALYSTIILFYLRNVSDLWITYTIIHLISLNILMLLSKNGDINFYSIVKFIEYAIYSLFFIILVNTMTSIYYGGWWFYPNSYSFFGEQGSATNLGLLISMLIVLYGFYFAMSNQIDKMKYWHIFTILPFILISGSRTPIVIFLLFILSFFLVSKKHLLKLFIISITTFIISIFISNKYFAIDRFFENSFFKEGRIRTFIIAKDEITLSYIPDPVKWSSAYHNGFLDILHTYQPYGFPIVLLVIIAYITLLYKIKGSSLSKNSGNLNSHLIFLYSSSFILFFTQVIPNASYIFALVPYLLTRILLLKK